METEIITFSAHTDNILIEEVEGTHEFNVKDWVLAISNGLPYKVENGKMWKLMLESGLYFKPFNKDYIRKGLYYDPF